MNPQTMKNGSLRTHRHPDSIGLILDLVGFSFACHNFRMQNLNWYIRKLYRCDRIVKIHDHHPQECGKGKRQQLQSKVVSQFLFHVSAFLSTVSLSFSPYFSSESESDSPSSIPASRSARAVRPVLQRHNRFPRRPQ